MYFLKNIIMALLIVLTSLSGISLAQDDAKKDWPFQLRFLGGPNGGQWFTMGETISKILSEQLIPTYNRIGGGVANIKSIDEQSGDLAFTLSCFLGAADSGEAEYQSLKADNVTILSSIYPQVLYILMRKEFAEKHNITDVDSLLNFKYPLKFASLKPGTASEFILKLLFKYGYNKSFDDLKNLGWQLSFSNYAEIADNFTEGTIDCFGYTAGTSVPLIKIMEEHTDVIILPIEQSVLDVLSKKFKTRTYIIQAGSYKSITKPIKTLGDYTVIITNKNLPNSLIYDINKALWKNKDSIAAITVDFGALSPETAIPDGFNIHPGSIEFWNTLKK